MELHLSLTQERVVYADKVRHVRDHQVEVRRTGLTIRKPLHGLSGEMSSPT